MQQDGMWMELISILTDIFRSRGYEVLISSEENSYLLLKRGSSMLAVGYADPGHLTTEGEAEMFLSMAEDSSADSMLFISPEKLKRDPKKILEKGGAATWDRMALAIAIGEQALSPTKDDPIPQEPTFDHHRIMNMFQKDEVDPLTELRNYEKETREDFKVISHANEGNDWSTVRRMERDGSLKIEKVEFPDASEGSVKTSVSATSVSEDILMGAWAGFEDWKKKEKDRQKEAKPPEDVLVPTPLSSPVEEQIDEPELEAFPMLPDLPIMEVLEDTPPEKRPWVGSILAPAKCSREEACAKAGVPIDTELDLEHVPNLLVSVSYSLKSEKGDKVERQGQYLYDPVKSGLIDIPEALAEELRSTLSVWDGKGPGKSIEKADEDDKGYVRALKDRLVREKHAEDRLVRETLMSTIYQEVRYLFDPSSFDVRWSRRVVVPYWIKRDTDSKIKWMVDAYLGRYVSLGQSS